MTDLQLSLLVGGGAVVAAVWAYNKWQEVRARRTAESMLPAAGDALFGARGKAAVEAPAVADRVEPVLSAGEAAPDAVDAELAVSAPAVAVAVEVSAAVAGGTKSDAAAAAMAMTAEPPGASELAGATVPGVRSEPPSRLVSPLIDYIAGFEMVEAVPGEQVTLVVRDLSRLLERRLIAVGLSAAGEWEPCAAQGAYSRLRIAIQLADRSGPLAETALDRFRGAMEDLADELLAVADLPPRKPALEIAQRLDAMCAGVDIQVGVNVVANGQPFAGSKLRTLAETAGLAAAGDGSLVRRDDEGRVMFRVLNHDPAGFSPDNLRSQQVPGITFLLDVPRVARADKVFNQMVELAGRFAETLGGALVDDNRRPITEQYLSPIRKQILQYQGVLANHGLPAGGDLALRLFS